jgi:Zn-finger protein
MCDIKSIPPATDLRGPECPYYPCHDLEEMLCDYCYCPQYFVPNCGGDYRILSNGVKDCSNCTIPHTPEGVQKMLDEVEIQRAMEIIDMT